MFGIWENPYISCFFYLTNIHIRKIQWPTTGDSEAGKEA